MHLLASAITTGCYYLLFLVSRVNAQSPTGNCDAVLTNFKFPNATITNATHIAANTNFTAPVPASCGPPLVGTGNMGVCRVQLFVNTTSRSSVHMEAWLPDTWFGRILGLGNGGLGGCVDYLNLAYGSELAFATIGSDNGHAGFTGESFLNNPDVILDFAFRSIHVENQVIKALVQSFYGRAQDKTYYLGCSTGGRQAIKNAEMFPEDFDGFVGGAPAADWNHLLSWSAFISIFASNQQNQSIFGVDGWNMIHNAIMDQCDGLDGKVDGIITEPDDCRFRPEVLECQSGQNTSTCLNQTQIAAIHKVFSPIMDENETLLYPRLDPGAEADGNWMFLMGGQVFSFTTDWYQHAIFNDTSLNLRNNFTLQTVQFGDSLDPGGISTFDGNLTAFMKRGGKFLSYHGRRDQLIASGNSKRIYDRISLTMGLPNLDPFYRTFMIPGMIHCSGGNGAFAFGQGGIPTNLMNDTSHNILLALVDWVENSNAPNNITGLVPGTNATRTHCRYPVEKSQLMSDGQTFGCVAVQGNVVVGNATATAASGAAATNNSGTGVRTVELGLAVSLLSLVVPLLFVIL